MNFINSIQLNSMIILWIYQNQYYNIIRWKVIRNDIKNKIDINEIDRYNKFGNKNQSKPFVEYFGEYNIKTLYKL